MKQGIYKLTSPSGKSYIGQSCDLKRRLSAYKNLNCEKQPLIYKALNKYGWDNFTVEILYEIESDEDLTDLLNKLETENIIKYNCIAPNGYNCDKGGNKGKWSPKKVNEYKKPWKNFCYRVHEDEPIIDTETSIIYPTFGSCFDAIDIDINYLAEQINGGIYHPRFRYVNAKTLNKVWDWVWNTENYGIEYLYEHDIPKYILLPVVNSNEDRITSNEQEIQGLKQARKEDQKLIKKLIDKVEQLEKKETPKLKMD